MQLNVALLQPEHFSWSKIWRLWCLGEVSTGRPGCQPMVWRHRLGVIALYKNVSTCCYTMCRNKSISCSVLHVNWCRGVLPSKVEISKENLVGHTASTLPAEVGSTKRVVQNFGGLSFCFLNGDQLAASVCPCLVRLEALQFIAWRLQRHCPGIQQPISRDAHWDNHWRCRVVLTWSLTSINQVEGIISSIIHLNIPSRIGKLMTACFFVFTLQQLRHWLAT